MTETMALAGRATGMALTGSQAGGHSLILVTGRAPVPAA